MYRPVVMGTKGMVASAHPLASMAGIDILKKGGNAVDAAITTNAVLNVTQPHMCGIGGDVFYLIYLSKSGKVTFLNGSGRAPMKITLEALREKGIQNNIPPRSPYAVTVPGCVAAWIDVWEKYGSMDLKKLMEPAVSYALGHPVSHHLSTYIAEHEELLAGHQETAAIFLPGGRPPRPGDILRQEALADSLRLIGGKGKSAFYEGRIAESIVNTVNEMGGFLSREDLFNHTSTWGTPIATTYRDYTIYQTAPNSQGITTLQQFNLVENYDLLSMGIDSANYIHHLAEAKKLSFADRDAYISDPEFLDIPIDSLLSKEYAASRSLLIDPEQAMISTAGNTLQGDTTYFAIVDGKGNIVSCIQSIYLPFGSGITAQGTGILLQCRGAYFSLDTDHPNCIAPGKRTLHTLTASIVSNKENLPCLVFGTMGADAQPQIHLQVISRILDFGWNIQDAIEAPRWVHGSRLLGGIPRLNLESRFSKEVIGELRKKGHKIRLLPPWSAEVGHAQGIIIDNSRGVLMGGADPRGDGYAIGW